MRTRYQLSLPGKYNAVEIKEPLTPYEMMSGLLVPLYASRAAEEAFFGPQGVTLSTSKDVRPQDDPQFHSEMVTRAANPSHACEN